MAIDGVKIIDSDLAHDVYNEFMDLYDANVEIDKIKEKIETWRSEVVDDVELEIFITSYALALWETGNLTEEIYDEVTNNVSKGAGPKMFLEEMNEKESKARQKELDKLITKIGNPKAKPRKRKTYKKVTNFLFEIDSLVTFKMPDDTYRAAIMFSIDQYRGNCNYQFTPTAYSGLKKPNESDIKKGQVFIHKIGCEYDRETVKAMQPGIEKFWKTDVKFGMPFTIGVPIYAIEHKDLINFKDQFEIVGSVKIADSFKKLGSIGYESTYDAFTERFMDVVNRYVNIFKFEVIELKEILE
jgi:hypothetical protein